MRITLNPTIPAPQLHASYVKNNICEAGYSVEAAARPLQHAAVVVAAYGGDEVIALGADFISTNCLEGVEDEFYRGLGLRLNPHSVEYILDRRPYVG